MRNAIRVVLVSEGSGGHLIPATEVAKALAGSGHRVRLVYVQRPQLSALMRHSLDHLQVMGVELVAIQPGWRLGQAARLWWWAYRMLSRWGIQLVVGVGGWVCIPFVLAARQRRIRSLLHEQNVGLGRANRLALRRHWVNHLAISFEQTRAFLNGTPTTVTGLPTRSGAQVGSRAQAAQWFGLGAEAWTVLVIGGSQGSRALNRVMTDLLPHLSEAERSAWQFIHLAGAREAHDVRQRYDASGVRGWVDAHVAEMAFAYRLADLVIARAGASTLAELARYGCPAILVPYPYAAGHQRDNARLVESVGGGVMIEEAEVSAPRLLSLLRRIAADDRLRQMMATQMRTLAQPDATTRLATLIEAIA